MCCLYFFIGSACVYTLYRYTAATGRRGVHFELKGVGVWICFLARRQTVHCERHSYYYNVHDGRYNVYMSARQWVVEGGSSQRVLGKWTDFFLPE